MPIYMDLHITPNVTIEEVARAHELDISLEEAYQCRAMTYWVDEERGNAFCLIEAPNKEAVEKLHSDAHGLVPHEIIEVSPALVNSFLGRIQDPDAYELIDGNVKVFHDPGARFLASISVTPIAVLNHTFGQEKTSKLLSTLNSHLQESLVESEGRLIDRKDCFKLISFKHKQEALAVCQAVLDKQHIAAELLGLGIGIHEGFPVENSKELFGDTIVVARELSRLGRNLMTTNQVSADPDTALDSYQSMFFTLLVKTLESQFHNPQLNLEFFHRELGVSQSRFFRLCKEITGQSPNAFIRQFRLHKALVGLKEGQMGIAEIAYGCGFSSPSYFSKCFQDSFSLLPGEYQKTA